MLSFLFDWTEMLSLKLKKVIKDKKNDFRPKERKCAKKGNRNEYQTIDRRIKVARIEISTVTQMQLAISYISQRRMQSLFLPLRIALFSFSMLNVLTIFNDNFFWHPFFSTQTRFSPKLFFLQRKQIINLPVTVTHSHWRNRDKPSNGHNAKVEKWATGDNFVNIVIGLSVNREKCRIFVFAMIHLSRRTLFFHLFFQQIFNNYTVFKRWESRENHTNLRWLLCTDNWARITRFWTVRDWIKVWNVSDNDIEIGHNYPWSSYTFPRTVALTFRN